MGLTYKEIALLADELDKVLKGAIVSNCFEYAQGRFIISFERLEFHHNLLLVILPPNIRCHLTRMKLRRLKNRMPYGEILKKALIESRLNAVRQVNGDRIIRFSFERESVSHLVLHLFPRGAGIFLVSADGIVTSAYEDKYIGKEYKHEPTVHPVVEDVIIPEGKTYSYILDDKYAIIEEQEEFENAKRKSISHLKGKLKRLERLLQKLDDELIKCTGWEEYNRLGNLIKSNLHNMINKTSRADILDYSTGETISIELDSRITAKENMEKLFKKASKLRRGIPAINENIEKTKNKIHPLKEHIETITRIDSFDVLQEYLQKNQISLPKQKEPSGKITGKRKSTSPFRYFLSESGKKIYVGRNDIENDRLTISFGKGSDFWCHAHGYPGSHVLVPLNRNEEIDPATFKDLINLALYYSEARKSGSAEILYTKKRYVSKTRGLPAGKVNVSKHSIVFVKLDEKRIRDIRERTREHIEDGTDQSKS